MKFYLYCRKSSEDSDRQIQSIEDQKSVMLEIAEKRGLKIIEIFEESQSAKQPGRKYFAKMLEGIQKGKAQGILSWKLDRLSRNPIDGGNISWLLQQGIIQKIVTNDRDYHPSDNVLMMSVELGMANQFILDLSKNVRRGNRSKCEKGGWCGVAPMGYVNDLINKTVVPDSERFHLVRKMWDLMLTESYTPAKIAKIARDDWKLKTIRRKKSGGVPPSTSRIYNMFQNPFYYGEFQSNGEWYIGTHDPMITKNEFDRVQKLIGKKQNPRPSKKEFAFTGLLTCKECGCAITAENKTKRLSNGKIKNYTYYHCTKKKNELNKKKCTQKCIEKDLLEKQVREFLSKLDIPDEILNWIRKHLISQNENEATIREKQIQNIEKQIQDSAKRLDNLIKLKISSENSEGELLNDEEFKSQKNEIIKEKTEAQNKLKNIDHRQNELIDLMDKTFQFAKVAKKKFKEGTLEEKKLILQCIGSNLTLNNQEIQITPRRTFKAIQKISRLEPNKSRTTKSLKDSLDTHIPVWQAR